MGWKKNTSEGVQHKIRSQQLAMRLRNKPWLCLTRRPEPQENQKEKGLCLLVSALSSSNPFQFFVWRKVYLTTHKTIAKTQTSFAFVVLLLLASPFTVLLPVAAAADVVVVVVVGRAVPLGGWHTG